MTLTTGTYHTAADWPEIEAVPGVFRRVLTCGDQMMVVQFLIKADAEVPPLRYPELFEAQVRRTPDETALVFTDTAWSFGELNAAANRLAHHLIGLGIGPERVVALALPRSAEMVAALLAVLKAGGAALPVDPGLPADRIGFMLRDAAPALALTTRDSANVHSGLPAAVDVLSLDEPATVTALAGCAATDPTDADPEDPADDRRSNVRLARDSLFVPRGEGAAEDDGWVLVLAYDHARNTSDFHILDAQNVRGEPVAVVHLPHRVPYGFHGNWVAA